MIRVLAIDGGGIRGIIPAIVLAELERRTGRPAASLFELIAGTSTGGILAVTLTLAGPGGGPRYSAKELIALYEQQGPHIFSASPWHKIAALGNLLHAKYPCTGLETALGAYIGEEARLKDALGNILVTAYDTESRMPFFYRSRRAREDANYDWPMRHVAQATSSAPTYFEPFHERGAGGAYALLDGGVFAVNPAMCALAEVLAEPGREMRDVLMVSLGTGRLTRMYPYGKVRSWGVAQWAVPLFDILLDGVSETVDYQMRKMLTNRYFRFTAELTGANEDLDDASPGNLEALKQVAANMVAANDAQLTEVARLLVQ